MIEKILERLEAREKHHKNMANSKTGVLSEIDKVSHLHFAECFKEAKAIVQEVAKEYGNASDNDLTVVSALPSLYPLQPFEEEAIHNVVASAKEGGWIPCSERLPEKYRICWITWKIDGYSEEVYRATCYKWGWFCIDTQEDFEPHEVVAWKYYEKPAPYQKGE